MRHRCQRTTSIFEKLHDEQEEIVCMGKRSKKSIQNFYFLQQIVFNAIISHHHISRLYESKSVVTNGNSYRELQCLLFLPFFVCYFKHHGMDDYRHTNVYLCIYVFIRRGFLTIFLMFFQLVPFSGTKFYIYFFFEFILIKCAQEISVSFVKCMGESIFDNETNTTTKIQNECSKEDATK